MLLRTIRATDTVCTKVMWSSSGWLPVSPFSTTGPGGEWNSDMDAAALFRHPDVVRPAGRLSVTMERDGSDEVVVANNMELTSARGTYRVVLKSGVKSLWTASGEFRLMGGGALHIPVPVPEGVRRGSVQVEVHLLKDISSQGAGQGGKVSDMYDVLKMKFPL